MWNPRSGWQEEFSMDHYNSLYVSVVFMLIYLIMALFQFYANHLSPMTSKHPLIAILSYALLSATSAMFFSAFHYVNFAMDGEGMPSIEIISKFLQAMSKFLLMSIVLLVSQGRCISISMQPGDIWRLVGQLGPFCIFCFLLEVWGEVAESRKYTTEFVYATYYGWALILVDFFWFLVYATNLFNVYTTEVDLENRYFYMHWGMAYAVWFLVLPVVTLLSCIVAPWVRFQVTTAVSNSAHALMFMALVSTLWPTRKYSHFKLHDLEMAEIVGVDDQLILNENDEDYSQLEM